MDRKVIRELSQEMATGVFVAIGHQDPEDRELQEFPRRPTAPADTCLPPQALCWNGFDDGVVQESTPVGR
jgi:hypothetical protein